MKLRDLEAEFVRCADDHGHRRIGVDCADAQGVLFLCPQCFAANGGPVGTHSVLCWFAGRGVAAGEFPSPRWEAAGTGIDDLTLSPSVQLVGACGWHGFVRGGDAK